MDNFHGVYSGRLRFTPALGFFLILVFGIPRFILVLGANSGGSYQYVSLLFLGMCLAPYLLLSRSGRSQIGMHSAENSKWWGYAPLLGILMCLVVYIMGTTFFGQTTDNWFVYISASYEGAFPAEILANRFWVFLMLTVIGITFSPIGEELLYRGLIHRCFVSKLGHNKASMVDSTAFALTHLAHFGIVCRNGKWELNLLPALLWVILMYLTSRMFFLCKSKGGSLYLAIICHAGFNLAMAYFISYFIL
jgi:membrane protease YdiL (CAAX protease family)